MATGQEIDKELSDIEQKINEVKNNNLCYFFNPYKWQDEMNSLVRNKNIALCIIANKNGKTAFGANTVISWALGYEPFSVVDKQYPNAVCVNGVYYKPSSLGIKPPVKIRIVGLDWKEHIGDTIVPELKKWSPVGMYRTKKNEVGIEYIWEWFNKSEFRIMCNSQDDMVFESFLCDGVLIDEPLDQNKFSGLARGLYVKGGKILFTMTPLKAAWVLDDLILSGRGDIGILDKKDIRANEDTYNGEVGKLRELGLNDGNQIERYFDLLLYENKDRGRYVTDKGRGAEEYLKGLIPIEKHEEIYKLKMLKFVKDCPVREVAARIFGEFQELVGKILKDFNRDIHTIEPIAPEKIPTDWVITPMIDWHHNKPNAISYWAIDKHNIHYCIKEVWENLIPEAVADDIIRRKEALTWNITEAYIDPFAKDKNEFDNRYGIITKDPFAIIEERLADHDISLKVADKRKEVGISNIETRLQGVNGIPSVYIFRDCVRHLFEIQRWVYDDNGKPIKENDHFMENWYRFELLGITYDDSIIQKYTPSSAYQEGNAWMGM